VKSTINKDQVVLYRTRRIGRIIDAVGRAAWRAGPINFSSMWIVYGNTSAASGSRLRWMRRSVPDECNAGDLILLVVFWRGADLGLQRSLSGNNLHLTG